MDEVIEQQKQNAKPYVLQLLERHGGRMEFPILRTLILESFMLRETNVKDICVELAEAGKISASWKAGGRRKPGDDDIIILTN